LYAARLVARDKLIRDRVKSPWCARREKEKGSRGRVVRRERSGSIFGGVKSVLPTEPEDGRGNAALWVSKLKSPPLQLNPCGLFLNSIRDRFLSGVESTV
jgi:hypothetical protein